VGNLRVLTQSLYALKAETAAAHRDPALQVYCCSAIDENTKQKYTVGMKQQLSLGDLTREEMLYDECFQSDTFLFQNKQQGSHGRQEETAPEAGDIGNVSVSALHLPRLAERLVGAAIIHSPSRPRRRQKTARSAWTFVDV